MSRRIATSSILFLFALGACSDGSRGPLDLGEPILSGTETFMDFEEFADGDTVTSSQGVPISLLSRGPRCADAITALDSGLPHGAGEDDLDLSSPNETFGGLGKGEGGEKGRKHENATALGIVLIIQESPSVRDENPSPGDNCADGADERDAGVDADPDRDPRAMVVVMPGLVQQREGRVDRSPRVVVSSHRWHEDGDDLVTDVFVDDCLVVDEDTVATA